MRPNTVVHARTHFVEHEAVAADQVVGGLPRTGVATLGQFGGLEVGIWEMTPGVMRDVESDEVFVVLAGSALIEFEDGTTSLTVHAGDVVRLAAGARTVWTVTELIRKVYFT